MPEIKVEAKASERPYGVKDPSQDQRPRTANEQGEFILIIGGLRIKPPVREAIFAIHLNKNNFTEFSSLV